MISMSCTSSIDSFKFKREKLCVQFMKVESQERENYA